jgi:trans-aconitate methyltransferase
MASTPDRVFGFATRALHAGQRPDSDTGGLEIWHTIYNHSLADAEAIAEWFRGSALRPFLARLDTERAQ